ncbi:DUF4401 domain-containing protein [Myroides sp. LJL115]
MENNETKEVSYFTKEDVVNQNFDTSNTTVKTANNSVLSQLFYAIAGLIGFLFLGLFITILVLEVQPIAVFLGIISIVCFALTLHVERLKRKGFFSQNSFMLYLGGFLYGVISYWLFFEVSSDLDTWCFPVIIISILTWVLVKSRMALYFSLFSFYLAVFFLFMFHHHTSFVVIFLMLLVSVVFFLSFYTQTIYGYLGNLQEYFSIFYNTSLYFALACSFVISVDSWGIGFTMAPWLNYLLVGFYIVINLLSLKKIYSYTQGLSLVFFIYFAILTSGLILGLNHYGFYNFSICYLFILCSYNLKFKMQWIFCSIAMVLNLGVYYYNLDITLLQKSMLLMLSGILMLGCYIVFKKFKTNRYEK